LRESEPEVLVGATGAARAVGGTSLDWEGLWERYGMATVLAVVWLVAGVGLTGFATTDNIASVALQSSFIGIAAVGMTMAIIAGTFDLSVGSTLAITAWVGVLLARRYGVPLAIAGTIGAGVFIGLVNGFLVVVVRIPALIATLGMLFVIRGVHFILSGGQSAQYSGHEFTNLGNGDIFGVPIPFLVFVVLAVFGSLVLRRTPYGRYLYAYGSNPTASVTAGVPVKRTLIAVFVTTALFTSIAAFLLGARLYSAGPELDAGFELNVIATVVLGGTRLAGGRGYMLGTAAAAMLFATLANVLNLLHTDSFLQKVAVGLVLVAALSIAGIRERLSERFERFRDSTPEDPGLAS
jgi:ribose transport system permease protein